MTMTRVARAARLHCDEVFKGVLRTPFVFRCMKAAHQAFQYGALWQREQDDHRIRGLKARIKNLVKVLEESYEHSRTKTGSDVREA